MAMDCQEFVIDFAAKQLIKKKNSFNTPCIHESLSVGEQQ
jgi:hypothetical protein